MPWFDEDGQDTVICQVCAHIVKGSDVTWRPDITGHKSAGNVCSACLRKFESKQNVRQSEWSYRKPVNIKSEN